MNRRVTTHALLTGLVMLGFASRANIAFAQALFPPPTQTIQHIIVVFQENRTPDDIFGSNPSFEPGVDITKPDDPKITCHGERLNLTPLPLEQSCVDPGHGHSSFVVMCDLDPRTQVCKMDGACDEGGSNQCLKKVRKTAPYSFVDNSKKTVQPYFDIARWYGFANRMF